MNGFTHALPYLDQPYLAVGCCLPDWLSICDRKCRARGKNAIRFVDDSDSILALVAQGVVQHHRDDAWFHGTPIFNKLMLDFAVELRELYGKERTMRPGFVAHIVVELLLDAFLNSRFPGKMELFYQNVETLDREKIQSAINRFATRPTDKLVGEIKRFLRVRYWFDYSTDEGLTYRINQVLSRLKLVPMGSEVHDWMANARQRVYSNAHGLLPEYPLKF